MDETQSRVEEELPHIAILGAGSMGGAVLSGLRSPRATLSRPVAVTTQTQSSAEAFAGASDVAAQAVETNPAANREAVQGARIVVLGVKPWAIHDLLREIARELAPDAVVVSLAAGITCASMEALVPEGVTVLRAMPNTPAHIGRGVTGISRGTGVSDEDAALVQHVFETVGSVLIVEEERIDHVSAVSGSGPAYLFYFAEQFTAAAERLGFTAAEARVLAQGTVIGAAELLATSGETPTELRIGVTTPNGTTEQAMKHLIADDWGKTLDVALAAAIRRSQELAAGD